MKSKASHLFILAFALAVLGHVSSSLGQTADTGKLQDADLKAQGALTDRLSAKADETAKKFEEHPDKLVNDVVNRLKNAMSAHCKGITDDLTLYGDLLKLQADGEENGNTHFSDDVLADFKGKHQSTEVTPETIANKKRDTSARIRTNADAFIKDMTDDAPYIEAISSWAGKGEPLCKKVDIDGKEISGPGAGSAPCLQVFNDKLQVVMSKKFSTRSGKEWSLPRFCTLGLTDEGNMRPVQYVGTGVAKNGYFNMLSNQLGFLTPQNSQMTAADSDFPLMEKKIRDDYKLEESPYFIDSTPASVKPPSTTQKQPKTAA